MNNSRISMIAIISKNRGLGKDNKLLFHIPGELPRLKKITMGHPIIMGRKTFESLNRPAGLPGRLNLVVSRDATLPAGRQVNRVSTLMNQKGEFSNVLFFTTLEAAIEEAKKHHTNDNVLVTENEVFILGGGQIYEQAMPFADRLYLTLVDKEAAADTFFPDYSAFTKVIEQEKKETEEFPYTFLTLERP